MMEIWKIFKWLSIHHAASSSQNHQSNGQAEACIRFDKRTKTKVIRVMHIYIYFFVTDDINTDQPGLPTPATLLFNRPTRGIVPRFSRSPVLCNNDKSNLTLLVNRWPQFNEDIDTNKNIHFRPTGSTVAVHGEDARLWMYGNVIGHGIEDHNWRSYKSDGDWMHNCKDEETWGPPIYQQKTTLNMRCQ